jgi:putative membrane protein
VRFVSHPIAAAVLSVGGMWLIYATPLFAVSQQSLVVHLLVMTHMLLAGYLFTASLISLDPSPHRASFGMRIGVLVLALAAHAVLAKTLYADGLSGVGLADVRAGAMLMYYAGDVIDAAIAIVLCAQWYRASGRRPALVTAAAG